MTRADDVAFAAELGAGYVGVIFAESPRRIGPAAAREVLSAGGKSVKRVGVFGTNAPDEIARTSDQAGLDVVQLHADPTGADVIAVREVFEGEIWAVVRVEGGRLSDDAGHLLEEADAIVLDARSQHLLGGTGQALPWNDVAADLARVRGSYSVVLAGGLTADNVGTAIRTLAPDVVDVCSGVESKPGVKDHRLMASFAAAVAGSPRH
jgi:phosphoribosylanthranilate isomerase